MKLKSKVTGEIQFLTKGQYDSMEAYLRRRFEVLDKNDGELQEIIVPDEIVDFSKDEDNDLDSMRDALKEKGVKIHHNLGDEKLIDLYNEHFGEND